MEFQLRLAFTAEKRKQANLQHVDVGIAEEQAAAMISGMAKGGLRPVWTVYSTFIQRAYDQIAQDLCINSNPAVINVMWAGTITMNDITHIWLFDIPMLCSIPGLIYLAPATCEEYFENASWAIVQDKKPIAIRVPSNGVNHTAESVDMEYSYEPKYKLMHKGAEVAIIAAGSFYQKGERVYRLLADQGVESTLINPRYLNAVDAETLELLKADHKLIVTLEDGCKEGGFGERIASSYGTSNMKVLVGGVRKEFYDRFDLHQLLADNRLLDEQITEDIMKIIRMKKEFHFNTVHDFNTYHGFKTLHPLVCVARFQQEKKVEEVICHYGLYALFLKENKGCKLSYGRTEYDFDEMTVTSFATGQMVHVEPNPEVTLPKWTAIVFHPDLLNRIFIG